MAKVISVERSTGGWPDIDLDFPQSKRGGVREYLEWRFGVDKVCAIGTISTLKPKGALADLSRAMNIPYDDAREMAEIIDEVDDLHTERIEVPWSQIIEEQGGNLVPWAEKYPQLFDKLEVMIGLIRQASTHAAGILVSDRSLWGDLPMREKDGEFVSQFDGPTVERLGFIKYDVLGIRHLDTLMEADKMVNGEHNPRRFYEMTDEDFSQEDIWENVADGRTLGVFQVEATGMTRVGRVFKPKNQRDVADLISVNRPGVIRAGMLDEYLDRRKGKRKVVTPHPMMDEILERTFGVVVFQEQVMKIVQRLAGYTLEEADGIRKIMGKMLYHQMKEVRPEFVSRCLSNPEFIRQHREAQEQGKIDQFTSARESAEQCWQQIEGAGIYAFNESHAQAYALVTSWGVYWKKRHFPEYITALLRTDDTKPESYIREARREGVQVLPPDINDSGQKFTLTKDGLRYGLGSILQVGPSSIKEILENQPFESMEDYLARTSGRAGRKKQVLQNLISIGAFDRFGKRQDLLEEFYRSRKIEETPPNFNDPVVVYNTEMNLCGVYITADPMGPYMGMVEDVAISSPVEVDKRPKGEKMVIGGTVVKAREHQARNGLMCFMQLSLEDEVFDVTCFATKYELYKNFVEIGAPVMLEVKKLDRGVSLEQLVRLDYL